jgi:hypothetical protein
MLRVIIEQDGKRILTVSSDGEARYRVSGKSLRDNVKHYKTDDDLHIMGLVLHQLTGYNSTEYLRRRLQQHNREEVKPQ